MSDGKMTEYFDRLAQDWDKNPMKIERSRATAEQCKKSVTQQGGKLLDIGGGTGLLSIFLKDHFNSITIADMSQEMLQVAEQKISAAGISNIGTRLIQEEIAEIAERYTAVTCLMTLHHVEDIDRFLSSVAQLLEERGTLMIADLCDDPDGSFHHKAVDFHGHHGFRTEELAQKVEKAGFDVVRTETYFAIEKENRAGELQKFPLFFMAAVKNQPSR